MKQRLKKLIKDQILNLRIFCFLFFLVIFVFINIFAARHILLENTRSISQDLIRNYALDEERNLEVYENLIKLGMDYLKDQITSDTSQEKLEHWLIDFFQKASNIANDDSIESFAIVNGQAIAANPWLGIENYNASEKSWYQQAVKANGDIIFTDAYMDSVYHRQVVTIAAADPDTGNAIA